MASLCSATRHEIDLCRRQQRGHLCASVLCVCVCVGQHGPLPALQLLMSTGQGSYKGEWTPTRPLLLRSSCGTLPSEVWGWCAAFAGRAAVTTGGRLRHHMHNAQDVCCRRAYAQEVPGSILVFHTNYTESFFWCEGNCNLSAGPCSGWYDGILRNAAIQERQGSGSQ